MTPDAGDGVLVTGGNGFIGSALLSRLEVGFGAHLAGSARSWPADAGGRVRRVRVEGLSATTDWTDALAGIRTLVHTAARVHVMRETEPDPLAAFRAVNVDGSVRLARQAAAAGVRRLVFLSSVKVNGEATATGRPFRADDKPVPEDPYGLSKLEAEEALREVGRQTGLEVVCVRCPLVYGPGVGGNFERMLAWMHRGLVLPLASVDNRRSLVSIGNLVDLVAACVRHPEPLDGVLMVSDGQDLSTPQLLRQVAAGLGRPARLLPCPVRLLDLGAAALGRRAEARRLCSSLQVDISQTFARVGWRPAVSVEASMRETAAAWLAANQ